MRKFLKVIKWLLIIVFSLVILSIIYLRFSRFSDKIIYQMNGTDYSEFQSKLNYEEFYFDVDKDVKLHGVLFKPDSIISIGTIFHYSGKGMHLNSSMQESYKPLLNKGFQIFCFERRNFGKSNGQATNTLTLKKDALLIFDKIVAMENVAEKPVIIWGQSLGGTFATMNANQRQEKISGLILEGTFGSFPDIGKVYANALNLENFKWIVPLIMNNDFPAKEEIKKLTIPTLVIHSKTDKQVPYELGREIFEAGNKSNTEFWDIDSKHIMGIYDYEEKYVEEFIKMTRK
jgi:hypothetical protein